LYTKNDPKAFIEELENGPMVVGVSTCRAFMQYHSGVLHDKECDE